MWVTIPEPHKGHYVSGNGILIQCISHRLEVPGGWIVRTLIYSDNEITTHQVFISDPQHEWKLVED